MLKLFTLKARKMSASLGLTGLELNSGLGATWCGGWGQRLVTVSSVARTVAIKVLRPKTTLLLLVFLCLEEKCHLTACWLQLAAVDGDCVSIIRVFGV